jgi:hypothetical protein
MIIDLNRSKIFFIGLLIIFIYILLNRVDYIISSNTTEGKVIYKKNWVAGKGGQYYSSTIKFSVDSKEITFMNTTDMSLELGETVSVIYKVNNPENAQVYSFAGFWLMPIPYCLIPLMILTAAVFSFLTSSDIIILSYKNRKFNITKTTSPNYQKKEDRY